jgi:tRNA (guanine-N7-)-methyltransferase
MHKKGHLEERLAACSHILLSADLQDKNMKSAAEKKEYLPLARIFGNDNPVHLEIGCGKGRFVIEMAKRYPSVNFVAVEKVSNVIIDAAEGAVKEGLTNVYFINCAAEVLPKYFEDASVERIYLNFSNPLPKKGFIKQRLTHPKFLEIYKHILVPFGEIWQKTDSKDFYEFSCESYLSSGYEIVDKCEDLKNNPFEGNVITEHESKFMAEGLPIYRVVAKVK